MISIGSNLTDWGLGLVLALLYYTAGFIVCGFAIMVITGDRESKRADVNATIRRNRTRRRRKTEYADTAGRILCYAKSSTTK